jgi:hypothetical protein
MDATWIITAFVLIDTLMEHLDHRSDARAQVPDSEVILIAVVAAKYFRNHHERAVCILILVANLNSLPVQVAAWYNRG